MVLSRCGAEALGQQLVKDTLGFSPTCKRYTRVFPYLSAAATSVPNDGVCL
jgi:hypothetical protein